MQKAEILKNVKIKKYGNGIILTCRVEHEILTAFNLRTASQSGLLLHPTHLSCCTPGISQKSEFSSCLVFLAGLCYVGEKRRWFLRQEHSGSSFEQY